MKPWRKNVPVFLRPRGLLKTTLGAFVDGSVGAPRMRTKPALFQITFGFGGPSFVTGVGMHDMPRP